MRRTSLIACISLLVSLPLFADNVQFKSAAGEAQGYLALPASDTGKHPAIIVIQEWWGLNDWVREQADRFAKEGYVALAVDLYRGKSTTSADEAHELMRGLPEDRAMADLKGGFHYLASRRDVDPKRIGVIGWCMGGGYSLMLAASEPRLSAAVVNYGHLMTDAKTIHGIKVPLLGNFGAEDRGIPAADVKSFEATLHKEGKKADFKVYDGAGHAFMNPNNKGGYVAAAAADAWQRIDRFFAEHLHAKIPNS
jgi:carboxymethylenebutenolidase